jgi:hypothetical protein
MRIRELSKIVRKTLALDWR